MKILGLTEWYEMKNEQLLKETSLFSYYFLKYSIFRYLITIIWFVSLYTTNWDGYVVAAWIVWVILLIAHSFYIQHLIDKKKPSPKESLDEYFKYRKSLESRNI